MKVIVVEKKEVLQTTIEKFLKKQKPDVYCEEALAVVRHTTSLFYIERDGVFVLHAPPDGALQKVELVIISAEEVYLSHHPHFAGPSEGFQMYFTRRRDFYQPQMTNEAF